MIKALCNLSYLVADSLGLVRLFEKRRREPVILCWHDVPYKAKAMFERQIQWLIETRKIVSLADMMQKGSTEYVSLTFDDGFESLYSVVFPILLKYRLPFTAFIPSSFLGRQGYINYNQLKEIATSGYCEIGAHTRSHQKLTQLSTQELYSEISGSKNDLEALLGKPVVSFAYPFGKIEDVCPEAKVICKEIGFQFALSTERGFISELTDPYWTPRICVSPYMNIPQLKGLLVGAFWIGDTIRGIGKKIRSVLS
jgi:peptidoglycan/xylan/chitin deacetylase (PgdA/CDA1 family)